MDLRNQTKSKSCSSDPPPGGLTRYFLRVVDGPKRVISVRYSNVALLIRSGSVISVPPGVMIPSIRQKCNMSVSACVT